jgi:hypothetical protein
MTTMTTILHTITTHDNSFDFGDLTVVVFGHFTCGFPDWISGSLFPRVDLCVFPGNLLVVLLDMLALCTGRAWSRHGGQEGTVGVLGVQGHLRTEKSQVFPLAVFERLEIHAVESFHETKINKFILHIQKVLLMVR